VAHQARHAHRLGVSTGPVSVDLAAVMARKDAMIDAWRDGAVAYYEQHDGIDSIHGWATLAGTSAQGHIVSVRSESAQEMQLVAPQVIINTGARSIPPPIDGIDRVPWLDHVGILALTTIPSHLVVVGGSYIGLEFGQIFSRFGSDVTIIEHGPRVVPREDPEISDAIERFLRAEGITVRTGAALSRVEPHAEGVRVVYDGNGDGHEVASHLLIAAGRAPNSDGLGLDTVGVATDARSYITVDDTFATNVAGIYAVGDVNGRGAFTHTSYQDHEILADHLTGGSRTVAGRTPTYALFTDPPLGRVGLTETEARAAGLDISVASYPMSRVTKAALDGETDGLVKLIVDNTSGLIVGAAMLGIYGDELIQAISLMMHAKAPAALLDTWLPVHPTVAEFLPTIYRARAAT
jgi:pyruvate/2-oxoglutarate dehydrogenase complex dihydrolipoamide dehydrogenase (E3) component